jgi:hypothetical protein
MKTYAMQYLVSHSGVSDNVRNGIWFRCWIRPEPPLHTEPRVIEVWWLEAAVYYSLWAWKDSVFKKYPVEENTSSCSMAKVKIVTYNVCTLCNKNCLFCSFPDSHTTLTLTDSTHHDNLIFSVWHFLLQKVYYLISVIQVKSRLMFTTQDIVWS